MLPVGKKKKIVEQINRTTGKTKVGQIPIHCKSILSFRFDWFVVLITKQEPEE